MYPRFGVDMLSAVFWCRVVLIESIRCIHIRTNEMCVAYYHLQETLQTVYVVKNWGVRIEREALHPGLSCILVQHGSAHRCEIVYSDEDGYSEVLLVDIGETIFTDGYALYYPDPLGAVIPALHMVASLHGLAHLELDGVAPILEEACAGPNMVGLLVTRNHGVLPTIRLLTAEHRDIGDLIVEELHLDIGYDNGAEDEGFGEEDDA